MHTKSNQSAYRWNTIAGILNALQSVVMLMAITRACDVAAAGVFTFAYANANLFLNVGKYGMRSYQASDRNAQFSFREYLASRIITVVAMIVLGGAHLAYLAISNDYTGEKTAVVGVLCLYEAVAALEDVFHGYFQQHDRLDVAARLLALRIATTVALFCAVVLLFGSLLIGIVVATVYTTMFLVVEIVVAYTRYSLPLLNSDYDAIGVGRLLLNCFPLFAAAFFQYYIGNAPRYAIDTFMDDSSQAYYGYIAMPVSVVLLLAGFIYNPMVASLADQWSRGQVKLFVCRFVKVALAIIGLTIAGVLAACTVGVPLLDLIYQAETSPYLYDLIVLVIGGGFLALAALAVLGIVIIRFQRMLLPVYIVVAVGVWIISGGIVAYWGIGGAAWTYFISMLLLAIILIALFIIGMKIQLTHKRADVSAKMN